MTPAGTAVTAEAARDVPFSRDAVADLETAHFLAHLDDLTDVFVTHLHRHRDRLGRDRKSTRLNSSHGYISYAVFCLKKTDKRSRSVSAHRACSSDRRVGCGALGPHPESTPHPRRRRRSRECLLSRHTLPVSPVPRAG